MNKNQNHEGFNNEIKNAIRNKDASTLLSSLNEQDKKLFEALMKDEKSRKEFLSSAEAQKIISSLFGGK